MKLGVYYNVFSGVEFLEPSLRNIRPFAAYVVAVYSVLSNAGTHIAPFVLPLLKNLQKRGLIDKLVEFKLLDGTSIPIKMQNLNTQKYILGRAACLKQGCTHLHLRDCDEFYKPEQFKQCLPIFERHDLVIAPFCEYFRLPTRRAKKLSDLYVLVCHKAQFRYRRAQYKVLTDKSRSVGPVKDVVVLTPKQLLMHHMTYVRYNERELMRKFEGHGHFVRLDKGDIMKYRKRIESMSNESFITVKDQFGILPYWKKGFSKIWKNC